MFYRGYVTAIDSRGVYVQIAEFGPDPIGPLPYLMRSLVGARVIVANTGDEVAPDFVVIGDAGVSNQLVPVALGDSPSIDAFGRLRTSDPFTLFASSHDQSPGDDLWETALTGSASATHLPAQAAVRLRTTTASGDKVVRQTSRYFRYLPGKSQLILLTGVMGAAATNVRKRVGYFDAANGLFFQQTSTGLAVVRRSSVSGSPVDTVVAQSAWNIDRLDGTGPSGVTIDAAKAQIWLIDLEWLGVGRVRMGVVIDGAIYYCHQFLNANSLTTVYMSTANLPVRYEIENTGAASSATNDFAVICSTVVSEGGSISEVSARVRSANNGVTPVSVSTRRPVLSIRPKLQFPTGVTNRVTARLLDFQYHNTGNQSVFLELVRGGTVGGSPSWASVGTTSAMEVDVAGSTITGGYTLWSGYVGSVTTSGRINVPVTELINSDTALHLSADGTGQIALSVVATSFGAASNGNAALTWREAY